MPLPFRLPFGSSTRHGKRRCAFLGLTIAYVYLTFLHVWPPFGYTQELINVSLPEAQSLVRQNASGEWDVILPQRNSGRPYYTVAIGDHVFTSINNIVMHWSEAAPQWEPLETRPYDTPVHTVIHAAGSTLYKHTGDSKIWRWEGGTQWKDISYTKRAIITDIAGTESELFRVIDSKRLARYVGGHKWESIDDSRTNKFIRVINGVLYKVEQIKVDEHRIWKWQNGGWERVPYSMDRLFQIVGTSEGLFTRGSFGELFWYRNGTEWVQIDDRSHVINVVGDKLYAQRGPTREGAIYVLDTPPHEWRLVHQPLTGRKVDTIVSGGNRLTFVATYPRDVITVEAKDERLARSFDAPQVKLSDSAALRRDELAGRGKRASPIMRGGADKEKSVELREHLLSTNDDNVRVVGNHVWWDLTAKVRYRDDSENRIKTSDISRSSSDVELATRDLMEFARYKIKSAALFPCDIVEGPSGRVVVGQDPTKYVLDAHNTIAALVNKVPLENQAKGTNNALSLSYLVEGEKGEFGAWTRLPTHFGGASLRIATTAIGSNECRVQVRYIDPHGVQRVADVNDEIAIQTGDVIATVDVRVKGITRHGMVWVTLK